ncbi:MAG: hypothetical protein Kow0076_5700 [Francisella sp.]
MKIKKIALTSLGIVGLGILSSCNDPAIEKNLKSYAKCNDSGSVCSLNMVMQTIEKNTYGQSKVINTEIVGVPSGATFEWLIQAASGSANFADQAQAATVNVTCKNGNCTVSDIPSAIAVSSSSVVTVKAKGSITYEGTTYKLPDMEPIVIAS